MAEGSLGQVSARIAIESGEAQQALQTIARLGKLAETQLKEVSNEARALGRSFVTPTGEIGRFGDKTDETTKNIRQFRQEQRLQNFVLRESTQALTATVFAMSFLVSGNEDASESAKRVQRSMLILVGTMNAVEFSAFAIGRATAKASVGIATLGATVARFGGVIGFILGAMAGLVALFTSSGKESKDAAAGIKEFTDALNRLAPERQDAAYGLMEERLARVRGELKELTVAEQEHIRASQATGILGGLALGISTREPDPARMQQLKEEEKSLAQILESHKEEVEEAKKKNDLLWKSIELLETYGTEIQVLEARSARLNDEIKNGLDFYTKQVLSTGEIRKRIDELAQVERDRKNLLRSTQDIDNDRVALAEMLHKAGLADISAVRDALNIKLAHLKALKQDDETRKQVLATQEALTKLVRDEAAARGEMAMLLESFEIEAITDTFEKRRQEANRTYREDLDNIGKKQLAEIEAGVEVEESNERARQAAQLADEKRRRTIGEINKEEQNEIARLRIEAIDDEMQREIERHRLEISNIRESGEAKELIEARIAAEEAKHRRAMKEFSMDELDIAEQIVQVLQTGIISAGNEGIQRFLRMLQIAIQIARAIQAAQTGKEGEGLGTALSLLNIIASFAGLFPLQKGGFTGEGGALEPAGIVHRGEIVFEKPIVDRHKDFLLGLRRQLQRSYATGGYVIDRASVGMVDQSALLWEVRELRKSVEAIDVRPEVKVVNPITLQRGLRIEMPEYERFRKKKEV